MTELLFERLRSKGLTLINDMIDGEQQESLGLDFKANFETNQAYPLFTNEGKKLTKSGRKTLAKATSGFANSMGGVLILGVDCRSVDGIDCAQKITPISNLSRALTTINNEIHSLTVPAANGIEAIQIPIDSGEKGLIAINIPRSARRPHRSNSVGAKSYYKRSGTSTVEMEHYEIEEAFLSNVGPELSLSLEVIATGSGGVQELPGEREYTFLAKIIATNFGGGIAKHLFLQDHNRPDILLEFGGSHLQSSNLVGMINGVQQVALPSDSVVHPGTERIVGIFSIKAFFNKRRNRFRIWGKHYDPASNHVFKLEFSISAEGMRLHHEAVEFDLDLLISAGRIPIESD